MLRRHCLTSLGAALLASAGCSSPPTPHRSGPATALPEEDLWLLNRATWGASVGSATELNRLGARDWLHQQLRPQADPLAGLPATVRTLIDGMTVSRTPVTDLAPQMEQRRRDADALTDDEAKKAAQQAWQQEMNRLAREAATRQLLRAVYSPAQLQEQLTWFWCNHFSVHQYKSNLRALIGDYEQQTIRPQALGRFADLLIACTTHAAMLRYLDNEQNAAGRLNENHARELMELHTLGVQSGYSQRDVQELARVLTGLGVRLPADAPRLPPAQQARYVRRGLTEFNPARHDGGAKALLGAPVAGQGWGEVLDTLRRLAAHPATGRFVCAKLARYWVADEPPAALAQSMSDTFARGGGDIAAVMQTLLESPTLRRLPPAKFKDPMRYVVSAVRLAYGDKPVLNPAPLLNWLNRLGEAPFNRQTPDGYPMTESDWSGSGQMQARFEVARAIGSGGAGLFKPEGADARDLPGFPLLANALYFNTVEATLSPATQAALAQASSPQEWNTLFLASPEFMRR